MFSNLKLVSMLLKMCLFLFVEDSLLDMEVVLFPN